MISRPADTEYGPSHAPYVALVSQDDVFGVLELQPVDLRALVATIPRERETHRYAPDKWNIRQVLGHVVDGERIFGYRALCISRGEQASLPAFDEQEYVANSGYDEVPLSELAGEFALVREANLTVFRRLDDAGWRKTGIANQTRVSVRALAFVMAGHFRHHVGVLRARYGVGG